MNINDYDTPLQVQDVQTRVEYVRPDYYLENRYPANTQVSIKGRRDFMGTIDRLEGENVIVKIFDETYSVPPQAFDSIFFVHPREESSWYRKSKKRTQT